ncbi:metallophosphoesterase family protein [Clostridium sp. BL-8]|uniref:metallophosphoesterase family protein n=1 Tax=Clostridium sp. BL-8 TaxID=349938 RepID=UPI00098C2617|nr:metallophosphoesterase family protein [Clostridium sp. BL-8]OOM78566.1 phosphodiesterase [Clostridium sp. BL-8]
MKIAVLSDIHGNGVALNCVIDDMKKQNINKAIILGDLVMKGPMPSEVMKELKKLDILAWIKGNTDEWFKEINEAFKPITHREKELYEYYKYAETKLTEEDIEFINRMPVRYSLIINGLKILCVHGTPQSIVEAIDGSVPIEEIKEIIKDVKEDVVLCGHSHCSFIGEVEGKKIFNVGSIGIPLDKDNRASYGILDFSNEDVKLINRRVNYSIDEVIAIAKKNKFPYLRQYENMLRSAAID